MMNEQNNILISVIIPTYKPGYYIEQCLESLKTQSLDTKSFEVLVILNGCSDPWLSDLSALINKVGLNNAKLFHIEEAGVSRARNYGLKVAKGQFIAFIDDDDYVSSKYLEDLLTNQEGQSVVLSDSVSFIDESCEFNLNYPMHKTFLKYKDNTHCSLFKVRSILNGPCMKLIPRSVIGDSIFDLDFKNGEDGLFMYEISKNIRTIKFSTEQSIYYRRIREGSAITKKKSAKDIFFNAFKLIGAVGKRYVSAPLKYNIAFTITRLLGPLKGAFYELAGKY